MWKIINSSYLSVKPLFQHAYCPFTSKKIEENETPKKSPTSYNLVVGAVAGTAVVVASPLILSAVGFAGSGIAAGSVAASWHSSIGLVAKGSLFSYLQSIGALGYFSSAFSTLSIISSAVVGAFSSCAYSKLGNVSEYTLSKWKSLGEFSSTKLEQFREYSGLKKKKE